MNEFFEREVTPHVPDAWINTTVVDHKDGEVGRVGYEINFTNYFHKYTHTRELEEIESNIKDSEQDIVALLGAIAGVGRGENG